MCDDVCVCVVSGCFGGGSSSGWYLVPAWVGVCFSSVVVMSAQAASSKSHNMDDGSKQHTHTEESIFCLLLVCCCWLQNLVVIWATDAVCSNGLDADG